MKNLILSLLATILSVFSFAQSNNYDIAMKIDPKSLAAEHNRLLKEIHLLQSQDTSLSTEQALLKIDMDLSIEERIKINKWVLENSDIESNKMFVLKYLKSDNAKSIFNRIDKTITNYTNYDDFTNEIDKILLEASNNLTGLDLKIIQVFGETSKASADYWYNQYRGNDSTSRKVPKWVTKDGVGISQGFLGWAIVAPFTGGGGGPAGLFLTVAVSGALASIYP